MDESYVLIQLAKTYGPSGSLIVASILAIFKFIPMWKASRERKEFVRNENIDRLQASLVAQLAQANSNTVALVREERAIDQANMTRFFDILERNTRAVEHMVEQLGGMQVSMGNVKDSLLEVKGSLGRGNT